MYLLLTYIYAGILCIIVYLFITYHYAINNYDLLTALAYKIKISSPTRIYTDVIDGNKSIYDIPQLEKTDSIIGNM